MRTLYTTFLIIALPLLLFSQTFVEKCFEPVFNSTFSTAIKDSTGNFYITGNSGWGFGTPAWITKINSAGAILFHQMVMLGDNATLNGIAETFDHNFIMCGYADCCDCFPSQIGIVTKYSANGNLIWMKILNPDTFVNTADNYLRDIIQLPNNCFAVHADSTLYYLNELGDSLWTIVIPGSIRSISSYGFDILTGNDSNLLVIDTLGNILNQVPFPGVIGYLHKILDSYYLVKAGNVLFTLDSVLSIINQVNLSTFSFTADLITFDSDFICIGNRQGSRFACFDHSLLLTDSFQIQSANVNCNALALLDSTLFVFGNESAQNSHQYYKSFSVNGTYNYHNVDLALTRVSFDTSYAYHPTQLPNGVFAIKFVAKLTVTNNGTEIIKTFNVNATSNLPGICGPGKFIQRFKNLSLLPGDSMQVTLDTLGEWGIVLSQPYNYSYSFCPWVSCPDSVTDKDHSNDLLCDSFLIDEIVFVPELSEEQIFLYPNPVIDILNVNSAMAGNQKSIYSILNSLNEVIETGLLNTGTINTSKLESGFYFLLIEAEGRRSVNKFIKMK